MTLSPRTRRLLLAGLVLAGAAGLAWWFVARPGRTGRLDVARPRPGAAVPVDSLAPSLLGVPVRVDLGALVEVVDEALPRRWGDLEERRDVPGNDRLSVAVAVERGPLSGRYVDSLAILSTRLAYRARAWYDLPLLPAVSTGCGLDSTRAAPRIDVTLRSPLVLDADWRLRSKVVAGDIAAASDTERDRCTVTLLDVDVTERVVGAAVDLVERMGPRADSAVAALDVRQSFAGWWELIARPVRLDEGVWLVLAPESVARGGLRGTGDAVETRLVVRARPRVVVGARPEVEMVPLPPLEPAPEVGPLVVRAEARADYGELTRRINGAVRGRRFSGGGRTLSVRDVTVSGVGDGRIAVAVEVAGDVRGTLYLVGTPAHDAASATIRVPDLDFDVATREALVEGAAFVARLGLIEQIRDQASMPMEPILAWARDKVAQGFNARLSDDVRLQGRVDSVRVDGVIAGAADLRVRAAVSGRVTLVVDGAGG